MSIVIVKPKRGRKQKGSGLLDSIIPGLATVNALAKQYKPVSLVNDVLRVTGARDKLSKSKFGSILNKGIDYAVSKGYGKRRRARFVHGINAPTISDAIPQRIVPYKFRKPRRIIKK